MAHKSEKDQRLLDASKRFDSAFSRYDMSVFNGLLHEDVVLHKDKLTLREDIHGIDAVKAYFQAYIDRYNFEHVPICGAVDEHAHCTFALHVDKQVSPKSGHHQQQHASGDAKPSDTIGVFHLRFDRGDERVRDIYFSRQLSHDEAQRKLKTMPDYSKLGLNDIMSYKGSVAQDTERAHAHDHAATLYNHIWATGDASMADKIMAPDVDLYNVVYGGVKKGVDEFKSMIKGIFSEYKVHSNRSTVAVTAGDKAFIHWRVAGEYKGDFTNNYGISVLVFNKQEKIQEVLTFMAPFPAQQREMLKSEE